jgi:hypothetical protein
MFANANRLVTNAIHDLPSLLLSAVERAVARALSEARRLDDPGVAGVAIALFMTWFYQKIAPEAIADKIKKSLASSGLEAP